MSTMLPSCSTLHSSSTWVVIITIFWPPPLRLGFHWFFVYSRKSHEKNNFCPHFMHPPKILCPLYRLITCPLFLLLFVSYHHLNPLFLLISFIFYIITWPPASTRYSLDTVLILGPKSRPSPRSTLPSDSSLSKLNTTFDAECQVWSNLWYLNYKINKLSL